ncbi:MAG: hypothetical protein ACPG42_01270 [Alphaproteobacteria bacterium]
MLRSLLLAGLGALMIAPTVASAQFQAPMVYNKTGYAPQVAINPNSVVNFTHQGQGYHMPSAHGTGYAATGGAPAVYSKARIPVYAPQTFTYYQQPVQVPVQQVYTTQKPVVYEAAVLPVVNGVEGAMVQQQQQQQVIQYGQQQVAPQALAQGYPQAQPAANPYAQPAQSASYPQIIPTQ